MKATTCVTIRILVVFGLALSCIACGGGPTSVKQTPPADPNPLPALIGLSPSSATAGASDFTLGVTGSGFIASSVVRWNGSNRSTTFVDSTHLNATISAADVASAGTVSVSISNPSPGGGVSTSVNFTIAEKPTLTISPESIGLDQGATNQFTATVTGMSDTDVVWSIREGNSGGAITSTGLYQAPAAGGTFHIVATSQADSGLTATAEATVNTISISISPETVSVVHGGTRTFLATVQGTQIDKSVAWSIEEGAAGGSITSSGIYTASQAPATYHVVASSQADPTKSASATVHVDERGFSQTGDMIVQRRYHTATMLQNGDVLVAGGISPTGAQVLASAEIYDHSTGTFRQVSSMFTQRAYHTAILLPDGKVLIIGGNAGTGLLASAELYDPVKETFSYTGDMTVVREFHTSTLLPDGRVLVVGGWSYAPDNLSSPITDSAEVYDPATGVFTFIGSLSESRYAHTATLLKDGRVFVAGGANDYDCSSLSSTEVFDPATLSFTPAAPMGQLRAGHTATVLEDGRVFLAGGDQRDPCDNWFLHINSSAEIFDPASNTISSLLGTDPRSKHTATLLPIGQVLIAGGYTASERIGESWRYALPTSSAELFDPATQAFHFTGEMKVPRVGHAATLLQDGRVLVTGGSGDVSAEIFE